MNCECIEKLLYLYRLGEQTKEEQGRVMQHLNHCISCRQLFEELKQFDLTMGYLRDDTPEFANKDVISDSIIHTIASERVSESASPNNGFWDTIISIFSRPPIRMALAGVSVCLVGLFIIQELFILDRIARLEESLSN
jgi:hypothetical protein